MVTKLLKAGFSVHGYGPTAGAAAALSDAGGIAAPSAVEAAAGADLVITMVPDIPKRAANLDNDWSDLYSVIDELKNRA